MQNELRTYEIYEAASNRLLTEINAFDTMEAVRKATTSYQPGTFKVILRVEEMQKHLRTIPPGRQPALTQSAVRSMSSQTQRPTLSFSIIDLTSFHLDQENIQVKPSPDDEETLLFQNLPSDYAGHNVYLLLAEDEPIRKLHPELNPDNEEEILNDLFRSGRFLDLENTLLYFNEKAIEKNDHSAAFELSLSKPIRTAIRNKNVLTALVLI